METKKSVRSPRQPAALESITPAVFHIMLALARGARHGYALMPEVKALTHGKVRLGPGTLYRSIQRMLVDGLIEELDYPHDITSDDERRRYYRLTKFGRQVARSEAERLAALVQAASERGLLPGTAVKVSKSKQG
jgi:DNA-binding PadR family transcriptional regulator